MFNFSQLLWPICHYFLPCSLRPPWPSGSSSSTWRDFLLRALHMLFHLLKISLSKIALRLTHHFNQGFLKCYLTRKSFLDFRAKIASCPHPLPLLYPLTMFWFSSPYPSPPNLLCIYFSSCLLPSSPHQIVSTTRVGTVSCSLQYPQGRPFSKYLLGQGRESRKEAGVI